MGDKKKADRTAKWRKSIKEDIRKGKRHDHKKPSQEKKPESQSGNEG